MRDFLSEQFAPTFAHELTSRLLSPQQLGERNLKSRGLSQRGWWTFGQLPLRAHGENGATSTGITVLITADWVERAPTVITHASFVRREADWHAYSDGALCYVLTDEWRDRLSKLMTNNNEDILRAIDYAATWLLAATDSLVTRHLLGTRYGIDKWPVKWLAYAHGNDGVREYLRHRRVN